MIVENKGSGMSLIDDLRQGGPAGFPMPVAFEPEHDKLTRMHTSSLQIAAGGVFLPTIATWLDDFKSEMLQFPHARHDDQTDSVSQFLIWIKRRNDQIPFSCIWIDPNPQPEEHLSHLPARLAAPAPPPQPTVLVSVRRRDRTALVPLAEHVDQIAAAAKERDDSAER